MAKLLVQIFAATVILGASTSLVSAETCGGKNFAVVKHGSLSGNNYCIGGSAKAFRSGGKFAFWSSHLGLRYFNGTRRGNTIYGSKMRNLPRRSTNGTFTAQVSFTDNGLFTWHWIERNRKYRSRLR